jgi:hypothetical protein
MEKENEIRLPTDEEMQEWRRSEQFVIRASDLVDRLYKLADHARLMNKDPKRYDEFAADLADEIKIIDEDAIRMRRDIQKRLDDWRNAPYTQKLDQQ